MNRLNECRLEEEPTDLEQVRLQANGGTDWG